MEIPELFFETRLIVSEESSELIKKFGKTPCVGKLHFSLEVIH